jgi:hypothetical protein
MNTSLPGDRASLPVGNLSFEVKFVNYHSLSHQNPQNYAFNHFSYDKY